MMVFTLGQPHFDSATKLPNKATFFGYYKDDAHKKKKNLGRIEQFDENNASKWKAVEEQWLKLFRNKTVEAGMSAMREVTHTDEWLVEAHMETDYSKLGVNDFQIVLGEYVAYLVRSGFNGGDYVFDQDFMENFIGRLYQQPTLIDARAATARLDTSEWEFFFLKDICAIDMGNKMDFSAMSTDNPTLNFVGRSSDNNGVMGRVDSIEDISPYPAGALTVALGGSLGSTFLQDEPFYTSQNVSVLKFQKTSISTYARLFLATMIQFESRFKYFPFGRELNKYIRTIFGFDLPINRDGNGEPVIDPTRRYHEESYVPDWRFMEDFIRSLAYGERAFESESLTQIAEES